MWPRLTLSRLAFLLGASLAGPTYAQSPAEEILSQCSLENARRVASEAFSEALDIPLFAPLRGRVDLELRTSDAPYFPHVDRDGHISLNPDFLVDICYIALAGKRGKIGFGTTKIGLQKKEAFVQLALEECRKPKATWQECLKGIREPMAAEVARHCSENDCLKTISDRLGDSASVRKIALNFDLTGPYFEEPWEGLIRYFLLHEMVHVLEAHFQQIATGSITLAQAEMVADVIAFSFVETQLLGQAFAMFGTYEHDPVRDAPGATSRSAFEASLAPPSLETATISFAHQAFSCREAVFLYLPSLTTLTRDAYVSQMTADHLYHRCGKHAAPAFAYSYDRAHEMLELPTAE